MDILLSTDNKYIMPTGVLMHSISTNNKEVTYHILVNEQVSSEDKHALSKIAFYYKNNIHFYTINNTIINFLPFGLSHQAHHVSIATYFRLFITDLLPHSLNKILYLDGDMIVRKPLDSLWNTDLTNEAIACVHDMDEEIHIKSNRLPYPMSSGYFNAGMLLINLNYWRENNCLNIFKNFIQDNTEKLNLHDQDVLNSVFWDKRKWINAKYNFQSGFIYLPQYMTDHSNISEEIECAKYNPAIIHFCAPEKPWMIECFHPHCAVWRHYWRKSQWKNIPLIGEKHDTIKNRLRSFALKHNLYAPKSCYQKIPLNS